MSPESGSHAQIAASAAEHRSPSAPSTSAQDVASQASTNPSREDADGRRKTKQTRNKPTLSCGECVSHKTKCDRGRPCLACCKRGSNCQYSEVADLLAADGRSNKKQKTRKDSVVTSSHNGEGDDSPASKCSIANITHPSPLRTSLSHSFKSESAEALSRQATMGSNPSSRPALTPDNWLSLSSLPQPTAAPTGLFGRSEHPFANYWTCKGGLAEVVSVLPTKQQADILISKYFEIVDPLYPIIDRRAFLSEYNKFWGLSYEEKCEYDAAVVALHFVCYASATQHIKLPSHEERQKTAEFYISAGHQAIRISGYLTNVTIPTVQAMILFYYFLINDNRVSDAWTFSGITQRQAYVLQLNREPDLVIPNGTVAEKNLRCRLWSAILFQESSIALFLGLPSTAVHCDVGPHSLSYDEADKMNAFNKAYEEGEDPIPSLCLEMIKSDISFCKAIWMYSTFIQENVCKHRALGLPLAQSTEHKRDLLTTFKSLYRSFPQPFGSYDSKRFLDPSRRIARQQIVLSQSFFHVMMLIHANENERADVPSDVFATLEAAHEALRAFFALNALFPDEIDGWWIYQQRAFEEATLIATTLSADQKPPATHEMGGYENSREYQIMLQGKQDVKQLLDFAASSTQFEQYTDPQPGTLKALYDTISVV